MTVLDYDQHSISDLEAATGRETKHAKKPQNYGRSHTGLLTVSSLPSYNRMTVAAIAMETWKAHASSDAPYIRDSGRTNSRAAASVGRIPSPLDAATMVCADYKFWNGSNELREASTLSAAKSAAGKL